MRRWMVAAGVVAALVLGVLAAFVLREPADRATSAADAVARPTAAASTAPSGPPRSRSPIEMASTSYFGRPFETIQMAGRYRGADGPRSLRVQLRQSGKWKQFPLPAVTEASGRFRAYVELGRPGRYQVRIVDPQRNWVSDDVSLLVF